MSTATHPSPVTAPWGPEYELLAAHHTSCPTCTAVDDQGVNLNLPCAEGRRLSEEYRMARHRA
ncbi:hypothetical protein ACFVOR_16580 [Streptomyces sp. NPDC057837]|uniref:hypothetical protein n=1 Tax=Streptomyces sp. NPDC057837 TaxID=3346260 RepID=UPI003693664D